MNAVERAVEACATHVLQTGQSTCIRYSEPGSWTYGFYVCWVPGHIFVGGDIGSITFVHYQAFSSMRSAMEWLARSEDDGYQLSKAKVGTELDLPRTRLHIEELMRQAEEYGEPTAGFTDLLEQCVEGNEAAIPALLAASACCQDYYGTESYGFHPRFQLACIRLAAKAWLAENPPLISDEAVS